MVRGNCLVETLKQQITDILEDLERKNRILKESSFEDVPPQYVGSAVYGYVINQLKGLIDNG